MDGINMNSFCFCLTLLVKLNPAISGTVEAIKTNLKVPVNQTANLQWSVVLDNGERISSLQIFVLSSSNVRIIQGKTLASTITPAGNAMFGNRLSGSLSNSIYTQSIKKIQFNEKKSFNLEVVFRSSGVHSKNSTVVIKEVVDTWASYKNKYGQKVKINTSLTTPAPPTNATDACKRPILLKVKKLDTKKLVLTIMITLVVTQVVNICIYGVVKYRGAETNCKNKQSAKNDDENKDGQDYEVFPTTESHYTGLQLEARKEIVYADLSHPTVNNYSEIGTENRSKQF